MIDFQDPEASDKIRSALKRADDQGKLGTVAAVTGIAGGVAELRNILNSKDDISIMDVGMLGMHLD